jgi:hypothetical protein
MTTPQYIPEEFQQEIDLPTGLEVDRAALTGVNLRLKSANQQINNPRIKELRQRLKDKNLSKGERQRLRQQLNRFEDRRDQARKARTRLQKRKLEITGQYDKLLKGQNRDAYSALVALFNTYGLGSLAGKIYDYAKQGYGADTISLLLQDTKEYKTRFAGNEARAKKGLPVLNPAEYLATESAFRQVLSEAGLPKGFYDNPADFTNWIAGDVSPTEIQDRVSLAVQATAQANPEYKRALKQMYGIDESELTAYFLDRKRAVPLLEKRAAAAQIGAAALRRGFQTSQSRFEDFATMGIGAEEAEQGFAIIGETYRPMQEIAARWGLTWDQATAEEEVFVGGNAAADKGKRLRSQERALFGGRAGSARAGLGAGYQQT